MEKKSGLTFNKIETAEQFHQWSEAANTATNIVITNELQDIYGRSAAGFAAGFIYELAISRKSARLELFAINKIMGTDEFFQVFNDYNYKRVNYEVNQILEQDNAELDRKNAEYCNNYNAFQQERAAFEGEKRELIERAEQAEEINEVKERQILHQLDIISSDAAEIERLSKFEQKYDELISALQLLNINPIQS